LKLPRGFDGVAESESLGASYPEGTRKLMQFVQSTTNEILTKPGRQRMQESAKRQRQQLKAEPPSYSSMAKVALADTGRMFGETAHASRHL
jgi:hypothetical protein